MNTLTKYFQNLTEAEATGFKGKVDLLWCTVSEGEAIYQPPGWLVATAVCNSTIASGIKMNTLLRKADIATLASCKMFAQQEGVSLKTSAALQCLDVVLAAMSGAPARS